MKSIQAEDLQLNTTGEEEVWVADGWKVEENFLFMVLQRSALSLLEGHMFHFGCVRVVGLFSLSLHGSVLVLQVQQPPHINLIRACAVLKLILSLLYQFSELFLQAVNV